MSIYEMMLQQGGGAAQSGDVAAQYIPTMNAIFAAQRAEVSSGCGNLAVLQMQR